MTVWCSSSELYLHHGGDMFDVTRFTNNELGASANELWC